MSIHRTGIIEGAHDSALEASIRQEVRRAFADQLAGASFWRRLLLERRIRIEIQSRLLEICRTEATDR